MAILNTNMSAPGSTGGPTFNLSTPPPELTPRPDAQAGAAPQLTNPMLQQGAGGGLTSIAAAPNLFSLPQNPFMSSVTAGTVNEAGQPSGSVNFDTNRYLTEDAAKAIGNMFGGNVVSQNLNGMGPAGAPSAPMYGLDMGTGDVQDMSWIATAMKRGDPMSNILARFQAGIAPPLSQNQANPFNNAREAGLQDVQWNMKSPLSQNLAPGQVGSLAGGKGPLSQQSPFSGVSAATHLGPQGGAKPTPFSSGAGAPQGFQGGFPGQGQPQFPGQSQFPGFRPPQFPGFQGGGYGFPGMPQQFNPFMQGGFNPFMQGNTGGLAGTANQFQRRPQFQGYGSIRGNSQPFSNSWYFPRFR